MTKITAILYIFLSFFSPVTLNATNINYEDLFENHQSVMLIINPDTGMIYYGNQAAVDFYGYSQEQLLSMSIDNINTLTPEEIAAERDKAVLEERNFFVFKHRLANGDIKTVHVYSYPVEIDGETYLYSIIIDQTLYANAELTNKILSGVIIGLLAIIAGTFTYLFFRVSRKKRVIEETKNYLQEQEWIKTKLISNLPGVAYRCLDDKDYTMLYLSDKIEDLTGYTPLDFYSGIIQYTDLIYANDYQGVRAAFFEAHRNKTSVDIVYQIKTKDNKFRWINETAHFSKTSEDGQEVIEGFIQDITDKRQANLDAMYYKDFLQYIISNSNQGIAVLDKNFNFVYISEAFLEMYGVENNNIIGKNHYEVFPDLPQKWRDVHVRCLAGEVLSGNRDKYIREDGMVYYTKWLCRPWRGKDGKISGIIIYTETINDLIVAEKELQSSQEQLQLVMENLPIGIALVDITPPFSIKYMNDMLPLIYGTTREETKQKETFWEAFYEDPEFRKKMRKQVTDDVLSKNPNRMIWTDVPITKNGKIVRYLNAYATPIPNTNLLISTAVDVTDRKLNEQEIIFTSKHDYLTSLPNRRFFEEQLVELDIEENYPIAILMMDYDGLKIINDAYGHDYGNIALQRISYLLKNIKRENDFVARIGGDEFVMICPKTSEESAREIKFRILDEIEKIEIEELKFSMSIGYALKDNFDQVFTDILKEAENNMYSKKILHGQSARNESVMSIFQTLKEKYDSEKIHSDRVATYCRMMGEKLDLSSDEVRELELAGLMHDIGKITIPDKILEKPGSLTTEEWQIMRKHVINGYQILRSADKYSRLAEYALTHHERIDGKGYPNGIKGDNIPLFSRVIAICDAYEAMTSDRPYRKSLGKKVAIDRLLANSGTQFDSELVNLFINEIIVTEE